MQAKSSRLETWGTVLALGVLALFGASFGLAAWQRSPSTASAEDGPGDPRATYRPRQSVEAWHAGRWYPAHVHSASADRYFITYDGFSVSWNEWVSARRLKKR